LPERRGGLAACNQ